MKNLTRKQAQARREMIIRAIAQELEAVTDPARARMVAASVASRVAHAITIFERKIKIGSI